jgi:phage tail-like protein
MAIFTANPRRVDPYKNFRFRVLWDGKVVAGVSKVSALKRTTEVVKFHAGNDPTTSYHMPGQSSFEAITLERGVTFDPAFEEWANLVYDVGKSGLISLARFRKDTMLQFLGEDGEIVRAYKVFRCWVSEYQALPELDANANAVAIEHMKIENEGWERDTSFQEQPEK